MLSVRNKLILGFIVLLIIIGLIFYVRNRISPSFTIKMSSQTVIKEMKALNRLETASFTIEKVIDAGTSGNTFQNILFGDRLLLIAHGQVIAGFDLSKVKGSDVTTDAQTLHITLPPPEILVSTLDENETRVYDRKQGLLTKGNKDLESSARSEAQNVIRKAACDGHILDEATKNGRAQLTALLKSLGYTTVIIDIPQGSC